MMEPAYSLTWRKPVTVKNLMREQTVACIAFPVFVFTEV